MDSTGRVLGVSYLAGLSGLGLVGGQAAMAQAIEDGTVPAAAVAIQTAAGPVMLSLDGLTMPGALVVSVILILRAAERRGPWRPTVVLEHRYPDERKGLRVVDDERP
jgi:hypothetical protein